MIKKIRNSLSVKVFLSVMLLTALCALLIYSVVMIVIPQHFQKSVDDRFVENTAALCSELESMSFENGEKRITDFCIENSIVASLSGNGGTITCGNIPTTGNGKTKSASIVQEVKFADRTETYILSLVSVADGASDVSSIFVQMFPFIIPLILLLAIIGGFWSSRCLAAPIRRISAQSKQMAELNLSVRCDSKRGDEIGTLANNLNTMASRLDHVMCELEKANEKLQADVDAVTRLEKQRRSFFAAVSHELKTPITILKGQIESMIMGVGDYKNTEKYLPQALTATESIEHLVKEILMVSKIEATDPAASLTDVFLSEIIGECVHNITRLAEKKGILIHSDFREDVSLAVNLPLFQKAMSNIIGNAVNHSPNGADVFIRLHDSPAMQLLTIENTGVTILPEDFPSLFTPFYRADKSRSKMTGGSGLGLYIVKAILDLHGFEYHIANTDHSVVFTIGLKKETI